jgi:hypothetical protein
VKSAQGFLPEGEMATGRFLRVPNFEANDRLKFTPEEQQAIQAAERVFKNRPQSHIVVRSKPRRGLAYAIAFALAYLLLSAFLVAVFHSFPSPESPRESAPLAEAIHREPQSQAFHDSGTVELQNEVIISQSTEVMSQQTSEPSAGDPADAPGQTTSAGPSSGGLPTQDIGEEDER